jgi:flagellar biosynthesis protein FlhF
MDIRRFESFSLQDAIKLVKVELGRDAVIISTREKEIYSEEMNKNCKIYEVTATPSAIMSGKIISPKTGAVFPKVDFPKLKTKNEAIVVKNNFVKNKSVLNSKFGTLNSETRDIAKSLAFSLQKREVQDRIFEKENERKFDHSKEKFEELEDIKAEILKVRKEIELLPQIDVADQIQEIKILLHDIIREKYRKEIETSNSNITNIGIRLRTAGVSENFIHQLINCLISLKNVKDNEILMDSPEKLKDFYLSSAIKFIFKYLKVTGNFRSETGRKKIICFVGPTGVGKTTTMAKIAAKIKLTQGKNVELISMDFYRIAAADQLRVYSKILDCPFAEVADKNELLHYLSKNKNSEYVFIDTAGRSTRACEQIDSLKKLLESPIPIEFHLVLSCTMKQRDIDETIKNFKFLSPASLIFTKLDESWAFGEILNSSVQNKIPLSYFTIGQKVPEDLEIASKERVVERLLKL